MPILNYTTEVPADRTCGEITSLLVRKGARSITSEFDETGEMQGISFVMSLAGLPIRFMLPANVSGVAGVLLKDAPYKTSRGCSEAVYRSKLEARAKWIAWRILKDWVAAQMALIESGQASPQQAFMPYAQQDDGRTMFQVWEDQVQRRLTTGG